MADFVKPMQSFAADLDASNPAHQELARRMIKGLADEPLPQSRPVVRRSNKNKPRLRSVVGSFE
jgi:hypothetical protein